MPPTRRQQDENAALKAEIEELKRRVVELQRVSSLGVLAGSVCHELNNALTPILNYARMALRNPDPEFRDRALGKIQESAQRASAVASGILGLARPRTDRRDLTDLNRLTEEVLLLVHKDLRKHRIAVDYHADRPAKALTNPAQIQQVVLNLVINARQAMPNGGELRIRIGPDPSGQWVQIAVTDTGSGIAPADLRRIFEPFFTTKSGPDATGQGGTGLGLSVCREIVEAHHGRLRAESRPGHGSTFTLILPAAAENGSSQGAA